MTLTELSSELETLVGRTSPAVASIEHRRGHGSGLAITPDGYVLTNWHVISRARSVRARLADGGSHPARVVGGDERTDLAVVRVDGDDLPTLPLHDDVEPRVGQLVLAIGNPLSLERSVSLGVISAVDRSLSRRREGPLEGLIQTDAAVNPGNSGGPLVDAEGRTIGINTAAAAYASGIGFAIPARTATWVAGELIRAGRVNRPRLGVAARSEGLQLPLSEDVGQKRGVRVIEVERESPAERAGLKKGDLLLHANGRSLGSVDDLQRVMVLGAPPSILLDIWRGHRRAELTAKLTRPVRA